MITMDPIDGNAYISIHVHTIHEHIHIHYRRTCFIHAHTLHAYI